MGEWVLSQVRPYASLDGSCRLPRILFVHRSKRAVLAQLRACVEAGENEYDEKWLAVAENGYEYAPDKADKAGRYAVVRAP